MQWIQNFVYKVQIQYKQIADPEVHTWLATKKELGVRGVYDAEVRKSPNHIASMINSVLGLDYVGAIVPNDVYFSGPMIRDKDHPPLKGELKEWLEKEANVVYLGLGTLSRLTEEQYAILARALDAIENIRILWKLPEDQHERAPPFVFAKKDKFLVEKWVPSQVSVLMHPNVKLFISHGGGNGFHEGVYAGKPQLVIPMWMDCYDFASRAKRAGLGLVVENAPNFSGKEITEKTKEILINSTYLQKTLFWQTRARSVGGPSLYADFILSCLPDPFSCKHQYEDPMRWYLWAIKYTSPILIWWMCKKLFVRLLNFVKRLTGKKHKRE